MAARLAHLSWLMALRARVALWSQRADAMAVAWSNRPLQALRLLLVVTVVGGVLGSFAGTVVNGDTPAYFRELMPGTWLSAAMLLAAAAAARAAYWREPAVRLHKSFWGLSAAILALLAVVEVTQPTIFLGKWLERSAGAVAPFGITNVDAALLIALLVTVTLMLLRRAAVLRDHPRALGLFLVAGALGFASQGLDSFFPVREWEFVAEESLKALAEPFLIAGYLTALAAIISRERAQLARTERR